jgi:hypothetical protein
MCPKPEIDLHAHSNGPPRGAPHFAGQGGEIMHVKKSGKSIQITYENTDNPGKLETEFVDPKDADQILSTDLEAPVSLVDLLIQLGGKIFHHD